MSFFIYILNLILQLVAIIIIVLINVAYFTLAERKILAAVQRRRGPNVVGFVGLLQPLADGLKLLLKEAVYPSSANVILFLIAPILTFMISLMCWAVIPFGGYGMVFFDYHLGILYLFVLSSLEVYGVLFAGWSSNSKYAFLGCMRSSAQMISYEVSMGIILLNVVVCAGSFNITEIVNAQKDVWYVCPLLPVCIIFFISALAETNRHPFDLPEAEAELVSGYNVEYSSMGFALFFLAEYSNMLLMSLLTVLLFFGGWHPPFDIIPFTLIPGSFWLSLKSLVFMLFFILARGCLPRYRYDQLMRLGWKVFLPFSLGYLMFTIAILYAFNGLPLAS